MARRLLIIVFALCLSGSVTEAQAERRVALLIGNAAYAAAPLSNPANDVAAMKATLTAAGFDVVVAKTNLSRPDMSRALGDFQSKANGADIAVVFFSGHGMEVGGTNYLIPTDAKLASERDVKFEAIPLDDVLEALGGSVKLRLILLDACRDNPFTHAMARVAQRGFASKGLARIDDAQMGANTMIAYAAAPGKTASDGDGRNSPFTAALIKHLATPGLAIQNAMIRVAREVQVATHGEQSPFVEHHITEEGLSLAPPAAPPEGKVSAVSDPDAGARNDYAIAKSLGTVVAWDAFLLRHPAGLFADIARAEREKLATPPAGAKPDSPRKSCAMRTMADGPVTYCVSSVHAPEKDNAYGPSNLFGGPAAAWVPDSTGPAVGAWVSVEFDRVRTVTGFSIRNGYQKDNDAFYRNTRVRALNVRTSEGEDMQVDLKDRFEAQDFSFRRPVKAKWLVFTIRTVYAGTRFTDTAVSKLDVDFAE